MGNTDTIDPAQKVRTVNCIAQNIHRNRNNRRARVGVLVSCCKDGVVKVGYSLCHKDDEFNAKEAYITAGKRMAEKVITPPNSIRSDIEKFLDRCSRYYKDKEVPTFDGTNIYNG
jgi:hypothetical protein